MLSASWDWPPAALFGGAQVTSRAQKALGPCLRLPSLREPSWSTVATEPWISPPSEASWGPSPSTGAYRAPLGLSVGGRHTSPPNI